MRLNELIFRNNELIIHFYGIWFVAKFNEKNYLVEMVLVYMHKLVR